MAPAAALDEHVAEGGCLDWPGDDGQTGAVGEGLAEQGVLAAVSTTCTCRTVRPDGAEVPLTPVRQPRQSLGRTATELLIDEVNNPEHEHRQVEFTPELIARTSTLG